MIVDTIDMDIAMSVNCKKSTDEISYKFATPCPIDSVYFLFKDNLVVYIGYSGVVIKRIGQHLAGLDHKVFDDYSVFYFDNKEDALYVENTLIHKIRPKYNKQKSLMTNPETKERSEYIHEDYVSPDDFFFRLATQ